MEVQQRWLVGLVAERRLVVLQPAVVVRRCHRVCTRRETHPALPMAEAEALDVAPLRVGQALGNRMNGSRAHACFYCHSFHCGAMALMKNGGTHGRPVHMPCMQTARRWHDIMCCRC